jgi:SAM-dependent methyltransferase
MHLDVHSLREFYYRSQLGRAAQKGVRDRVVERWGNVRGLSVAGYGFAVPLLRPFLSKAERVIGLMPAPQGVMHWPADGPNHSVLCDEARWPVANDSIDRLVLMHGLETSDHPMALLDEAHRALAPQGRALIVVPSRGGMWARSDKTPFGHGRPYSRGQIERLLSEGGFVATGHTSALFFPPSSRRFWMRSARGLERLGHRWGLERMGGVLIVEAVRRDTAAPRGLKAAARRPLSVLEGVPQSGAQPAWRR